MREVIPKAELKKLDQRFNTTVPKPSAVVGDEQLQLDATGSATLRG